VKSISTKLGIWPNDRLLVINADMKIVDRVRAEQNGLLNVLVDPPAGGTVPMILIWLRDDDDPTTMANAYKPLIDHTGQIWFFFPKKEFVHKNQLTVTRETVAQDVSRANLEMTKVCSIDAETQAMGFVLPF
jgi:hypothetical protein